MRHLAEVTRRAKTRINDYLKASSPRHGAALESLAANRNALFTRGKAGERYTEYEDIQQFPFDETVRNSASDTADRLRGCPG
ncbi:hypothetical protein [Crossiella cryophila]|uniref:Uncharacterized protein n=1 Tax=Crossiella cryophila TaxID=43355 RepID=A0A7W7FYT9_9PSEU|nr:hypothetical protein [Crossiella cryophila]MBB4682013.1 hypothetical protein [Crossiella cryophila]